jgi:hypothetical protein
MSEWVNNAISITLIIVVAGGVCGMILGMCYYRVVDYSHAEFQPGQMVEFVVGGKGQVVRRSGENTGSIWNMIPVIRYKVRRDTGRKIWYEEWELQ